MRKPLSSSVIRKKKKCKGQWVSLEYWTYRRSDGHLFTHETLVDDDTSIVLPLDSKNRVWMLREFRDPLNAWSWRLAWGYLDQGESPESAARRELAEEAGLKARRLEKIFVRKPEGKNNNRVHAFLATGLTETASRPEAHEKIRIQKIPLARAVKMALAGKINEPIVSMLIVRVGFLKRVLRLKPDPKGCRNL